jgi:acetate kinase
VRLLAINAGSSSLKWSVYDAAEGRLTALHEADDHLVRGWDARLEIDRILDAAAPFDRPLNAVGHRLVFGGPDNDSPIRSSRERLCELDRFTDLEPLHLPGELALVRAVAQRDPDLAQVLCFDTAFHRRMPAVAKMLPLPSDVDPLLQRYGFHGLSYEYVVDACSGLPGRAIVAHLGSGASLCALLDGVPQDTTMGFSALGGLMMATRPGDLDPGVLLALLRREGYTADGLATLLQEHCGLAGVSGISGDIRVLLDRSADDSQAARAIALFQYQLIKQLGSLVAILGGLDRLVFTGGIGEHSPQIRAAACNALGFLGLELDDGANQLNAVRISKERSRVEVGVVPTNENLVIARHTSRLIGNGA